MSDLGSFGFALAPRWGIYDQSGNPVIEANAVWGMEFENDYRISDYPQEQGAFQTYNKVKVPFRARIIFLISGELSEKNAFFTNLEQALASLSTFVVWTPEYQYPSVNIVHYGFRREAREGAQLIKVEVWTEEVRIIGSPSFQNTASPSGSDPQQSGEVQPQTASVTQYGTGSTVTNLPNTLSISTGNSLDTPITPNYFSNTSQLPQVPHYTWNQLTADQQSSALNWGYSTNASGAVVSPPDSNGNVQLLYGYS